MRRDPPVVSQDSSDESNETEDEIRDGSQKTEELVIRECLRKVLQKMVDGL